MFSRINQFFIVSLVILGVGLLSVILVNNREVSKLEAEIRQYETEIIREEEKIRNLQLEIAHLSDPRRIERLTKKYLPNLKTPNAKDTYIPVITEKGLIEWYYNGKQVSQEKILADIVGNGKK